MVSQLHCEHSLAVLRQGTPRTAQSRWLSRAELQVDAAGFYVTDPRPTTDFRGLGGPFTDPRVDGLYGDRDCRARRRRMSNLSSFLMTYATAGAYPLAGTTTHRKHRKIGTETYSASSEEAARAAAAASRSARAPSRASSWADANNRAIARASPRGANAAVSEGVSLQDWSEAAARFAARS